MQLLFGIVALLAIVVAAVAITIAGVAMVRRDARNSHHSGSLGNAMQELESLFVESKQHVLKTDRAEEAEEESPSGDPPEK